MFEKNAEFGKKIAERRKNLGITQQELAKLLKIHPTYLSKMEREGLIPRPKTIRLMALCLSMHPSELTRYVHTKGDSFFSNVTSATANYGLSEEEEALVLSFRKLSSEGKQFISSSLKYVLAGEGKTLDSKRVRMVSEQSIDKQFANYELQVGSTQQELIKHFAEQGLRQPAVSLVEVASDSQVELAMKEFQDGDKKNAIEKLQMQAASSTNEQVKRKIARFLFRQNEIASSRAVLDQANLTEFSSKSLMAQIIEKTESAQSAIDYLRKNINGDQLNKSRYLMRISELLIQVGDVETALKEYLEINPSDIATFFVDNVTGVSLGVFHEKWELSEQYARQIMSIKGHDKDGASLLGFVYSAQRNSKGVSDVAAQLIEKYPTEPIGHLLNARAKKLESLPEESFLIFERAIALNLEYNPSIDSLIEFYLENITDSGRVISLVEKFLKNGSVNFYVLISAAYRKIKNRDKVVEVLKSGISKYPKSQRLAYELSREMFNKNLLDEAEEGIRAFVQNSEASPSTLTLAANIQRKRNNLDEALVFAERAVAAAPKWISAGILLFDILTDLGQDAKALSIIEEYKNRKDLSQEERHEIFETMGGYYLDKRLYDQAIPLYEIIAADKPKDIGIKILLGFALVRCGQYKLGIDAFKHACNLDKNDTLAANNLAYAYNMNGEYSSARQILQNILKNHSVLKPKDLGLVLSNLAHSLIKLSEVSEAENCARKAIAYYPEWAEAHFNLGLVLVFQKKFEEAHEEFQLALKYDDEKVLTEVVQRNLQKIPAKK